MHRREFLVFSSVTSLLFVTGCGGNSSSRNSTNPAVKTSALPIPKLLKPTMKNGIQHYDLDIKEAKHTFFEDKLTDTFAINDSSYLGPTLLLQQGDRVSINYKNNLKETITMHGHGMHVPPTMDGTAHQAIAPNQAWSPQYTVNQKACTNWYHPHTMEKTAEQVYQGLAGLIIVEDDESRALDLPKRYGVDDIPLVLQDRYFASGQIDYSPSMREIMHGYTGDTFIANGAIEPTLDVEAKQIRFRILNGSNSSVYELGFSDGRKFKQIATDNGFLEAPVSISRLRLSPAERAEIVIDLSGDLNQRLEFKDYRHNKTFMTINVSKSATQVTTLANKLTTLDPINVASAVRTRSFLFSGRRGSFQINGKSMDMKRIDERVPLGQTEIWEVKNNMGMDHNFHIHATHFRLIERDGSTLNVAENEKGYKDVVFVPANGTVKLLIKMIDYTNATVPYMYHCHFLEHEDRGMMGQFVVV